MTNVKSLFPLFLVLYTGFVAAGGVASAAVFLQVPVNALLIFSLWAITVGIYTLNRYTDIEDMINDPSKRLFFKGNFALAFFVAAAFVVSIIALTITGKFSGFHGLLIGMGIIYSVPLLPIYKNKAWLFVRLKDIPLLKSATVSLLGGSAFFLLNYFTYPHSPVDSRLIVLMMISCTLVVFVNTNFCDIRDVVGDRASGIPTIPAKWGVANTLVYAMALPTLLWIAGISVLWINGFFTWYIGVFFLANALYPAAYIIPYFRIKNKSIIPTLIADTSALAYAAGLAAMGLSGISG